MSLKTGQVSPAVGHFETAACAGVTICQQRHDLQLWLGRLKAVPKGDPRAELPAPHGQDRVARVSRCVA
jgi:hypothetical protein